MSKIVSTGSCLPSQVVTNTELVEKTGIDSSDEWISQRTGIRQRYIASEDESLGDLASQSAQKALDQYGKDICDEINLIIVATMSSKGVTPAIANQVQKNLGIEESWGFDVSSACSGFITALEIAEKLSHHYPFGYTLVIGAEKMSDILDWQDRSSSILFGDGAGAILIKNDGLGLSSYRSEVKSVPDTQDSIHVPAKKTGTGKIAMAGREVFNFVLRRIIPSLADFIESLDGDMEYLISHQANSRFVDIFVDKLGLDSSKVPINIDRVANTSGASIPILLDELVQAGKIHLNGQQKVVLTGFGGGLTWGHLSFDL